jgi:lysophospholipase L1-like esterase
MGIQSGLIYEKNGFHYLSPSSTGVVFNKKVFIDKNGFRIPQINFKYIGKKNILIIGDSTTFGNGVLEENSFIGILRDKYKNINFFNSAVPGYQIRNHSNNLKNFKKKKNFNEINKIIYFFSLNDIFAVSNVAKAKEKKVEEGDSKFKKIKLINFLNSNLRNKSYLYMYLKGIASDPSKRWYQSIDKFYSSNNIAQTSNYFLELINFSKEYNAELFVIILPYEYQTRNCNADDLKPQKKLTEVLVNNNLKFFDFTKKFCEQKNPNDLFYKFDPAHLSVQGHKLVFNLINDKINF